MKKRMVLTAIIISLPVLLITLAKFWLSAPDVELLLTVYFCLSLVYILYRIWKKPLAMWLVKSAEQHVGSEDRRIHESPVKSHDSVKRKRQSRLELTESDAPYGKIEDLLRQEKKKNIAHK